MDRIESLEDRRMFADVSLAGGGLLTITGTSGDDHVQVALLGKTQIRVSDGTTDTDFNRVDVKQIRFTGGDGNDSISLGRVRVRAYLDGGNGDDSLSASTGDRADTLIGGDGNDYLYGGRGNDSLDGGDGGDIEIGGDGDDYLEAKSEVDTDDTVMGGDGQDTVSLQTYRQHTTTRIGPMNPGAQMVTDVVYGDVENFVGSRYNDHVYNLSGHSMKISGGAGNDKIEAGDFGDTIVTGPGRDTVYGGAGDDTIYAKNGSGDFIYGGTGTDRVQADSTDVLHDTEIVLSGTVVAPA